MDDWRITDGGDSEQVAAIDFYATPPAAPLPLAPPAAPLIVRRQPDNHNALLSLLAGLVAIAFGALPFVTMPAIFFGLGAVALGVSGLRRVVNYGAKGRALSIAGLVAGGLGLLAAFAWVIGASLFFSRSAAETFAAFDGAITGLDLSTEVGSVEFGGTGSGTFTLDGVAFPFMLDSCGLAAPAPGVALGGRGYTPPAVGVRELDVAFLSTAAGAGGDAVAVTVGSQTYLLEGERLFVVEGDTVRAEGEWQVVLSAERFPGRFEATCTS